MGDAEHASGGGGVIAATSGVVLLVRITGITCSFFTGIVVVSQLDHSGGLVALKLDHIIHKSTEPDTLSSTLSESSGSEQTRRGRWVSPLPAGPTFSSPGHPRTTWGMNACLTLLSTKN